MKSESIIGALQSVTKAWAKQRKAEERGSRRPREYYYSDRVNFTEVAAEILPTAYQHASGDGQYTVSQRQMYYASREAFKEKTGREIKYSYFSQTILRRYLNQHDPGWKITADSRGKFTIPNGANERQIPVGTIQIDDYLLNDRDDGDREIEEVSIQKQWPSWREGERYAAVLYIEKEGFDPVLEEAKIAERFDLAIVTSKGQSVVAARKLVDFVCAKNGGGVPLFTVHDFDKYGFSIASCLTEPSFAALCTDRVAYFFQNEIDVTDLGLRLADAEEYNLASERCKYKDGGEVKGATKREIEFLQSRRRVELNAFTAPQFIEWLTGKLSKHLPDRLVPSDDVLEQAYRRAIAVSKINRQLVEITEEAKIDAATAKIPKALSKKVRAAIKETGEPWDVALYRLIGSQP